MRTSLPLLLGLLIAATMASGCGFGNRTLTVYGASSLKTALDQIKADYEASHFGIFLSISTGSSTTLRTQIEQGAPADLFLSADTENVQAAHRCRPDARH